MTSKRYYIGKRVNPQFKKPYYKAYGQLSKADVKKKENAIYGSMVLAGYDTFQEYNAQILQLQADGFSVHS